MEGSCHTGLILHSFVVDKPHLWKKNQFRMLVPWVGALDGEGWQRACDPGSLSDY